MIKRSSSYDLRIVILLEYVQNEGDTFSIALLKG